MSASSINQFKVFVQYVPVGKSIFNRKIIPKISLKPFVLTNSDFFSYLKSYNDKGFSQIPLTSELILIILDNLHNQSKLFQDCLLEIDYQNNLAKNNLKLTNQKKSFEDTIFYFRAIQNDLFVDIILAKIVVNQSSLSISNNGLISYDNFDSSQIIETNVLIEQILNKNIE